MKEQQVIDQALQIIESQLKQPGEFFGSVQSVSQFLTLKLARSEREIFSVMFMDSQIRLISYEELFLGTVDASAVYPREVVKRALELNASAVVFAHNHPSGSVEPSRADREITERLTDILSIVDVRVLDHIIVGGLNTTSFAERGLI